jgi:indole-3-glycerol phosphate synthase
VIEKILETKKKEIEALRGFEFAPRTKPVIPFTLKEGVNIIAELKKKSPSAGNIGEIDNERIALYSRYAAAISILTDTSYFGGSFELLTDVAGKTDIPILCKDFFIDTIQVDLAYSKGADIILLIARILDKVRLQYLYGYARNYGLNCLVEIHEAEELEKISCLNPEIVGVNARDLDTLAIDLDRAKEMLSLIGAPVRVAESGIKSGKDMERFNNANCFLIGETLMRSQNLESTFRELLYG